MTRKAHGRTYVEDLKEIQLRRLRSAKARHFASKREQEKEEMKNAAAFIELLKLKL